MAKTRSERDGAGSKKRKSKRSVRRVRSADALKGTGEAPGASGSKDSSGSADPSSASSPDKCDQQLVSYSLKGFNAISKLKSLTERKSKTTSRVGEHTNVMIPKSCSVSTRSKSKNRESLKESDEKASIAASAGDLFSDKNTQKAFEDAARLLIHEKWYHGLMPRDEIEELIKNSGDFIVRKTEVGKIPRYVVSVVAVKAGKIHHILILLKDGRWVLRDVARKTISELIMEHVNKKTPIHMDGTVLLSGVPRPDYYILHEHIEIKKRIGGGAFGDVFMGTWKKADGAVEVAVKRLKGRITKKERVIFLKEAKLMKRLDHRNIVRLYGIAPQQEPMMIVLEFAANGCLKIHLKSHPETPVNSLIKYLTDASRGMYYLASRKVIHRDVAARNCLLGKEFEVKISDFGMSEADANVIKLDKLRNMPIKWLAPETLRQGIFTTKTDVWSFGVLIWEIFSHCRTDPFPGETNTQAKDKILSGKQPMQAPTAAPVFIGNIMQQCFCQVPEDRVDFDGIFRQLAPNEAPPLPSPMFFTGV
ncbi:Tyrosine-protein kinase Fer [Toxocara canis]|uniref:Tyrosine-protein kinase n=1 Tax=Toxocara canis TaxID=6265 RepID=A0A0B2W551_TOXCA|nr:Tyrosine-protein kinase Fer [Toxocara canis]